MIRALATVLATLMASTGPETVEIPDVGPVDLTPFTCSDTPRSTLVQRVCYHDARRYLLVSARGRVQDYCDVPADTVRALLTAPSLGHFYVEHIERGAEAQSYVCAHRRS